MRILLTVDPEIPVPPLGYGGIERIVHMLVMHYCKLGFEVTLSANRESKVPCELKAWEGGSSRGAYNIVANTLQLTKAVYAGKFDVLHSFSRLAYLTAVLPLKLPKIMSYQREPTLSQVKKANMLARRGSLVFTGCSNYISDQISAVAESYTIYNGAPIEVFKPTVNLEEDAPLMFLGRVEPIKGTHLAIEVARRTGKHLIIAGNIPQEYTDYFEEMVRPFLNDKIRYVGTVDDSQKNHWLGKSAALLMPIQWNEPFGIVMAEAMACGTPVLGFGRGSVPEVVEQGVTGFVSNTVDEMVADVGRITSIDRRRVREVAEERFSDEKICNDYIALYRKLSDRKKRNS